MEGRFYIYYKAMKNPENCSFLAFWREVATYLLATFGNPAHPGRRHWLPTFLRTLWQMMESDILFVIPSIRGAENAQSAQSTNSRIAGCPCILVISIRYNQFTAYHPTGNYSCHSNLIKKLKFLLLINEFFTLN